MRDEFLSLLQKSVSSLHSMLDDVMDLARLQAGRELLDVKPFDVAVLLKDVHEHLRPLAADRGLFLKIEGPNSLSVEGDPVKIQRIAQNLLINALKYTEKGGVSLSWGDSRSNDPERWTLCIEDTGPGFHSGPGAPLAGRWKKPPGNRGAVEEQAGDARADDDPMIPWAATPSDPRPVHQERGEGIGLSIVKRLCELLDASVELDSQPGVGTTFRIVFPRHYHSP